MKTCNYKSNKFIAQNFRVDHYRQQATPNDNLNRQVF